MLHAAVIFAVVVPAVPGAAADRAPDPALVRRQRGGVDHLHAVLPDAAARRATPTRTPPTRSSAPRTQAILHIALLAAAAATLPIAPSETLEAARATRSRSAPSCCCSAPRWACPTCCSPATSPLVQAWFARARPGANPYRLFARVQPRFAARAGRLSAAGGAVPRQRRAGGGWSLAVRPCSRCCAPRSPGAAPRRRAADAAAAARRAAAQARATCCTGSRSRPPAR